MSSMKDLYIDIVTDLSEISADFKEAIKCGCKDCESWTIVHIEKQFNLRAGSYPANQKPWLVKSST